MELIRFYLMGHAELEEVIILLGFENPAGDFWSDYRQGASSGDACPDRKPTKSHGDKPVCHGHPPAKS